MRSPAFSTAKPWWARSIQFNGVYLNINEIGRRLEISHSQVRRLMNGERTLSVRYAEKLAGILEMDLDTFLSSHKVHVEKRNHYTSQ